MCVHVYSYYSAAVRANSPLLVLLESKWIIIFPLSRSVEGWATPENGRKQVKCDSLESLKFTPLDGGWFCRSASTLGFLPSAPVWRGVEGNGMCYPEHHVAWMYNASESTEVSESRSWRDASKGLELASRKSFMQEHGPSECGPMCLHLSPSVLEKVKWSIFLRDCPHAVLARFWLPNKS